MNDIIASLPEVQKRYSNCNLLLPQATDVQLNPFYKFHVEEVPVDISDNSGDIFKVGSVKNGRDRSGKDVWVDTYSLTKPLLNKMAMAAGIQFNPKETYGQRIDRVTYRAQAQGAMKKADGTARTETDQKVICLEDEEEKYRIEFSDKAAKGITDEKQAKAASEIFAGEWVSATDKWGRTCNAYVIAKEDRDRYVERSVMVNMALLKKTWAEKCMTGAKLRVIRALLGVKGTYTKEELKRNFAIPTVVFSPDYSDPQVRQMMISQGMASANNMFGVQEVPVRRIEFSRDTYIDADLDNAAFQSDMVDDPADDYRTPDITPNEVEPPVRSAQDVQQHPEPAQAQENRQHDFCCDKCGVVIAERVWNYSYDKFGRPLCMKCQKEERR